MSTKLDRTIERLETALMIRPDDRHQRVQLGRAYQQAKRYLEAEEAYQRVLKAEPNSAEASFSLGLLRDEQGRPEEALDLYARAVAADSEHTGARRALAEHAAAHRDWLVARSHYEHLTRLLPRDAKELRAHAAVLVQLSQPAPAAELLERALASEPGDEGCVRDLCAIHAQLGNWARLAELALPLVDDPGLGLDTLSLLGRATRELGSVAEAERVFRAHLSREENTEARWGLAWVHFQRARHADVLKELDKVSRPTLEVWLLRGRACFALKKWTDSVTALREAVGVAPGDGEVQRWLGLALLEQGSLDEAVTHLRHAVRYLPGSVDSWVGLGDALTKLEQWNAATEPMQQAAELEPKVAIHHARLGEHHARLGRPDLASVCFETATHLSPNHGEYWLRLGQMSLIGEDYVRAERELRRAVELLPSNAGALAALGLARVRSEHWLEAVAPLEQALHLDPSGSSSRLELARVFLTLERFSDALLVLNKAPAEQTSLPAAYELRGRALFALRRYEEAEQALSIRTSLPDVPSGCWECLGLSLERLGRAQEAEVALVRAVESNGVSVAALAGLGRCRVSLGEWRGAMEPLERLVRLAPRDVEGWRLLGQSQAESGLLREGRDSLERALVFAPEDGLTVERYGLVLATLGDHTGALEQLSKACQLLPRAETAWRKIAELEETAQHLSAAIEAWRKVLGLAPQDRRVPAKLAQLSFEMGDFSQCLTFWRRVLGDEPNDVSALTGAAHSLTALGRDPEAVDYLKQVLRLAPERHSEALALGTSLARLGAYEDALPWLRRANDQTPTADGFEKIAACLERLERPAEEVEALQDCLSLSPERGGLWRRLGLVALQLGYRPRGITALETARRLGQDDETLRIKLADALRQTAKQFQGDEAWEPALHALEQVERLQASDPALFAEQAVLLQRLDRRRDAIERWRRAGILAPDNVHYLLELAELLLAEGEQQEALTAFRKVTEREPSSFEAWVGLGKTSFALGKVSPAIDAYRRALAQRDSATEERFVLAQWLKDEGQLRDAAPLFERVLSDEPLRVEAARGLALCLTKLGELERSVAAWRSVLRGRASDVEALMGLSKALWQLLRPQEASFPLDQLYEQLDSGELASAPPGFWELRGRVAYAGQKYTDAESALERALAENHDVETRDELETLRARSLLEMGRFDDALRAVERRLASAPEDAELLQLRASALFGAGQSDAAVTALRRVLTSPADVVERERAAEKLADLLRQQLTAALEVEPTRAEPLIDELLSLGRQFGALRVAPEPAEAWYEKVVKAHQRRGERDAALRVVARALEIFPNNAVLLALEGEFWEGAGVWERAADAFERSQGAVATVRAGLGLGRVHQRLGRPSEALAALQRALALATTSPTTSSSVRTPTPSGSAEAAASSAQLVQLHEQVVQVAEALGDAELLVKHVHLLGRERSLAAGEWRRLGFALLKLERHPDAVEAFEAVLDEHPDDAEVLFALATALHRSRRGREALVPLKQLVKDDPGCTRGWVELARRQAELGAPEAAVEAYEQVAALGGETPEVAAEWVTAAVADGNLHSLERALAHACRLSPSEHPLQLQWAETLERLGNAAQAMELLSGLLQEANLEAGIMRRASLQLAGLELGFAQSLADTDPEQARWVLTRAGEHALGESSVVLAAAQELAELGAVAAAVQVCDRALSLNAESEEVAAFLGGLTMKRGEYVRAAEAFERIIPKRPDQVHVLLAAGRARQAAGQPELALPWLRRASHLDPRNAEVVELLEKTTAAVGKDEDTLQAQETLLEVSPTDAALHERYVRLLAAQGQHDRVALAVRRAENLIGPVPVLFVLGAAALRASGRYAEAVQLADKALALTPQRADALRERGSSLIELGELESGVEALLQARAAEPDLQLGDVLPLGLVGRGRLRIERGEFEGAARDFEQALREGAEPLAVLPNLVNAAWRAKQLASALTAAGELASLQSTASNWCMVGELRLEVGLVAEAAEAFRSANDVEPTGEAYLGLGTAYLRLGDPARAQPALQRAAELRPGADVYEHLTSLYARASDWPELVNSLEALAQHRPLTDAECLTLASACEKAGDLTAAASSWSAICARQPSDVQARWELGRLSWELGHAEAAAEALTFVVERAPHHAEANGILGRALAALGRKAEALEALERQARRAPQPELLATIAALQKQLGQAAGSLESLERVVQLDASNDRAWMELAQLFQESGRHNDAVSAARRAVGIRKDDASRALLGEMLIAFARGAAHRRELAVCRAALGECLTLSGITLPTLGAVLTQSLEVQEPELAERAAELLLESEPEDPRLHAALARALGQRQNWKDAAAAMERAVNLVLRHQSRLGKGLPATLAAESATDLLMEWSVLLERAGNLEAAVQAADRVLRMGTSNPAHRVRAADIHQLAAEDLVGQGVADRALPLLERAAELTQRPAEVAFLLLLAHRLLGNRERAVEAARDCLSFDPTHVGAFRLGKELTQQLSGASPRALLDWFEEHPRAVEQEPKLRLEFGVLLVAAEQHDAARRQLKPLLSDEACGVEAALTLADSFNATLDWEQEVATLSALAKREVLDLEYQRRLTLGLEHLGRVEEAAVALHHVLEQAPGDVDELMRLASLQLEVKREGEALATLERVLASQPEHLAALRMKSWLLKVVGRVGERTAVLTRITQLDPQATELEELADLCLTQRQPEAAEAALARWVALHPRDARAHFRCGLVRAQWGDPKRAIESLEQALRCDPSLEIARERLQDLYDGTTARHLASGRFGEALAAAEGWLKLDARNANARSRYAECLLAGGDRARALEQWRSLLNDDAGHVAGARAYAAQLAEAGHHDDAEMLLAKALGANREAVELMIALAQLYVDQRKFEQAEIVAKRALKLAPQEPELLVLLSQVAANTARPKDAEQFVRQALVANPNHSEANYTLGKLYLALGRFDLAKAQLDKLVRINSPRAQKFAARLQKSGR